MEQTESKKIEEEHSNIEFIIDLKFYGLKSEDNDMLWAWTIPFDITSSFIYKTEFLSENYFEILSIKRDWKCNGYDVKIYTECCPHCFYEQLEKGFNKTTTYSIDNIDITSFVKLIGYKSNGG